MDYEDLHDTMNRIIDKAQDSIENLCEQYERIKYPTIHTQQRIKANYWRIYHKAVKRKLPLLNLYRLVRVEESLKYYDKRKIKA